jgi:hypothetical protein
MKTIALTNGMVIFVDQIAFIHVQQSTSTEGAEGAVAPEIHVHFSAALTFPKGSRSMRAVVGESNSVDFMSQLERYEVDCSHMRRRLQELKRSAA